MTAIRALFILMLASVPAFAHQPEAATGAVPDLKELKLQRSDYPATLTGDCAYEDAQFNMTCSFFISRVAARKSDGRVNDMLLRMYGDRTAEEWKEHPMCTAPEVKDLERHIKVMRIQKKISKIEEDMIRREVEPAVTFCNDPTLVNYKAYLQSMANEVSCSVSTSIERVNMRYDAESQTWTGVFVPKLKTKPMTEYQVKLDSITGQVGKRLIFMVTQTLKPQGGGGGRPTQLIYRAKRADQKHFCGYVEW